MQSLGREPSKFKKIDPNNPTRCHRCESFMIYQKFYGSQEHFWGWKCVCCGEIVDQIISENRRLVATGQLRR